MRDTIIEQLKKLGITVNADISDEDLAKKLNDVLLKANKDAEEENESKEAKDISDLVANAVSAAVDPLKNEISNLKTTITANSNKELTELATSIVNSKKFPGFELSDILDLGLDKAQVMAANCGVSYSIGSTMSVNDNKVETLKTNVEDLPD